MPGETAVVLLQSLLVKSQLATALRREDLILDGADDLPPLVHEQNVQPTATAIQYGVPFPLRRGIRPCAASNAILVNGGCSQTRAALGGVEQEMLKEINPGAVAPLGVQQPGQAPGVNVLLPPLVQELEQIEVLFRRGAFRKQSSQRTQVRNQPVKCRQLAGGFSSCRVHSIYLRAFRPIQTPLALRRRV